jgi:hypothetical protein
MGGLLRLLVLALALWLLISSLRRLLLLLAFSRRGKAEEKEQREQKELPLVQDLQCGRFVLEQDAVSTFFDGQALHFCSQECRDLYCRSHLIEE